VDDYDKPERTGGKVVIAKKVNFCLEFKLGTLQRSHRSSTEMGNFEKKQKFNFSHYGCVGERAPITPLHNARLLEDQFAMMQNVFKFKFSSLRKECSSEAVKILRILPQQQSFNSIGFYHETLLQNY
jgi:hypothetical protein